MKGFVIDLAPKKTNIKKPIFTNPKKGFEHIKLPAKVLDDFFLQSNRSIIKQ